MKNKLSVEAAAPANASQLSSFKAVKQSGFIRHCANRGLSTEKVLNYVTVPEGVTGQDEAGRLWDVVWLLRFAILRSPDRCDRLPFALYVRNDQHRAKLVKLIATCGPLDIDDPQPAITVMLPDED
jgi:hypothetical protein